MLTLRWQGDPNSMHAVGCLRIAEEARFEAIAVFFAFDGDDIWHLDDIMYCIQVVYNCKYEHFAIWHLLTTNCFDCAPGLASCSSLNVVTSLLERSFNLWIRQADDWEKELQYHPGILDGCLQSQSALGWRGRIFPGPDWQSESGLEWSKLYMYNCGCVRLHFFNRLFCGNEKVKARFAMITKMIAVFKPFAVHWNQRAVDFCCQSRAGVYEWP